MTVLELILGIGLVLVSMLNIFALRLNSRTGKVRLVRDDESESKLEEAMKIEVLAERRRIRAAIEAERGTKVITLIHRKEPWLKETGYITIEDTESILREIRNTPRDRQIDLILHTPGGLALAAEMIATALKEHPATVTVMVPFYAMSGGTLIALAADEIHMEKFSVLGPIDPQIRGYPSAALRLVLDRKKPDAITDDTIILAEVARLAVSNITGFAKSLLKGKMDEARAERVAQFLAGGYITHDTPITIEVAKAIGLEVTEGVPQKIFDLFLTCEHGACERPSLAYTPSQPKNP